MSKIVELYTPYKHQKAVHDAITEHIETTVRFTDAFQKIFVVKACRQVGKSAMAENELSRFALHYSNSINAYIAPTYKLSKKTYENICSMFVETKLIVKNNASDLIIQFENGSVIKFFSAEQRENLRGFTVSGIMVIDEAAFIPDKIYNEALSPWVDAKKAITLIISTPKFKFGFFYDYFQMGIYGKHNVESFDFMEYNLTHIRSDKMLEQKRITVPFQTFQSEYLGIFLDAQGCVFGDFSGCIIKSVPEYSELYIGLDFGTGSGQDYTVLTAINEKGQQVFIWRKNDLEPTQQVNEIIDIFNKYEKHIKGVLAEQNSIGKIYLDMLKKRCPRNIAVSTFNTDKNSKRRIVETLQVAFQNNSICILDDLAQTSELSLYEQHINRNTNNVSYSAPNGCHDDIVMALMLAYEIYRRKKLVKFRIS